MHINIWKAWTLAFPYYHREVESSRRWNPHLWCFQPISAQSEHQPSWGQAELSGSRVLLLLSPNLFSTQDWPRSWETDELSGLGITTIIWKDGRLRRWQVDILENRFTSVRIQASFILKWGGVWLFVANFLGQESFVLAPVQVGQFMMFL